MIRDNRVLGGIYTSVAEQRDVMKCPHIDRLCHLIDPATEV